MNGNAFDARLDTVPMDPGVYLMKDASGSVIYVGKAKKLRNRLRNYFGGGTITHPKVAAMVSHVADFEYVVVGSESEALLLEANLIKRYSPKYNILLRDDKGYPYCCITLNEEYPRVFKAFRPDEKARKAGAVYYGPYMSSDLFHTLETIYDIFPLKRCRKVLPRDIGKERPCLNAHIGKCMAPCSGSVSAAEYRKMIGQIVLFFEGQYDGIEADLKEQMLAASEELDFERAAVLRDRLEALANIKKNQRVFMEIKRDVDAVGIYSDAGETAIRKLELRDGRIVGSSTYFISGDSASVADVISGFVMQHYDNVPKIPPTILVPAYEEESADDISMLEDYLSERAGHKVKIHVPERGELRELLKLSENNAREMMVRRILRGGGANADPTLALRYLEKLSGAPEGYISRVESYDISNLGNDDICAGMVVFKEGKPDKASYRLFKMKTVTEQDDFASMREVLSRRLKHNKDDGFEYPSLILVDGGKGQLGAVKQMVDEFAPNSDILLAGMVKNNKHRTSGILFTDDTFIKLDNKEPSDNEMVLLRFLTAVQNEVHRYAITYQRKLSKKRNIKYRLENIEGIGPAKRKALLSSYGSIKEVEEATVESLKEVKGISSSDALAIYTYFHPSEDN